MSKKYKVEVQEVHIQTYEVSANSPQEAKEKVYTNGEEYLIDGDFVYSHTTEPESWYVTEITE